MTPSSLLRPLPWIAAWLGLGVPVTLPAQSTSAAPAASAAAGEVVTLSPFEISASEDRGYLATSTMAGSRINSSLRDVAAQISVMTPEFLSDVGATSLAEAYLYSTNTEGTYEHTPGSNVAFGTLNIRVDTRVRGLNTATNSRNFFRTLAVVDGYNTERLTFASGPNSVLFGLGSPGGIVDSTLKRANFANRAEVAFRADNHDSTRSALDLNRVLVPGRVALRVAALYDDSRDWIKPNHDRQNRYYGTLTVKPFTHTTARYFFEHARRDASRTQAKLPFDFVTPWIEAGRPLFDNSRGNAVTGASARVFTATNALYPIISIGNTPSVLTTPWNGTVTTKSPTQQGDENPKDLNRRVSLVNPAVFPFDTSLWGNHRGNQITSRLHTFSLEQRVFDRLFVELAYNREDLEELKGEYLGDNTFYNVYVDANRYLPDRVTPNPNAGKYYTEGELRGFSTLLREEEARLTASYEFDFTRRRDWARWAGRHTLAGMRSRSNSITALNGSAFRAVVTDNLSFTRAASFSDPSRLLRVRYYLGDPANPGAGGDFSAAPLQGRRNGPFQITDPVTGRVSTVQFVDHPDGAFSAPTGTLQHVESTMGAWQSHFLQDRLIAFYGVRRDDISVAKVDPRFTVRQPNGLFPTSREATFEGYTTFAAGTSDNRGLVLRPLPWFSFHFSQSENYGIPTGNVDVLTGEPSAGTNGTGRDYGLRIDWGERKLSLRVNWFENSEKGITPPNDIVAYRGGMATIEQRIRGVGGLDPSIPADVFDPVAYPVTRYNFVRDSVARGLDIEVVANPSDRWRVSVTAGRQRTTESNIGRDWFIWEERRRSVWENVTDRRPGSATFGVRGWDNLRISDSSALTIHQHWIAEVKSRGDYNRAIDGQVREDQREWRVNLFSTYDLRAVVKGLTVGGGCRYRSGAAVGFPLKTINAGTPEEQQVFDVQRPYMTGSEFYTDLMVSFQRRLAKHLMWKGQINVRNALDRGGLTPLDTLSDGTWGAVAMVRPRQILFTSTFTF
ncbi:MAG: hypothetical protein HZC55_02640 [Verrucomicrobia bacterium]|nr:hypothetical protein [Verrucomicrobiota bacterium]